MARHLGVGLVEVPDRGQDDLRRERQRGDRRTNAILTSQEGTIDSLFAYKAQDEEVFIEDAKDNQARLLLDRFRAPTRVIDAENRQTVITRDSDSRITQILHPSGLTETATYSGPYPLTTTGLAYLTRTYETINGAKLLKTISGDRPSKTFFWGDDGVIDSTWVTADSDTLRAYYDSDSFGRIQMAADPAGHEIHWDYSISGLRNTFQSYDDAGTTFFYTDEFGRVVKIKYPDDSADSVVYNL